MLTDDATKARWANEGLPTDPLSVENGSIMCAASRWSLMIDPQLQGIKWIINREEPMGLVLIQQSQHKYIDKVRRGDGPGRFARFLYCMYRHAPGPAPDGGEGLQADFLMRKYSTIPRNISYRCHMILDKHFLVGQDVRAELGRYCCCE
jgi:hypothetical protein